MIQRANTMIVRSALLLLLSCASLPLLASEGRMDSPDGNGDCPNAMVVAPGDGVHGGSPGDAMDVVTPDKTGGSAPADNAESGGRPPRMHNLIPGMFR